jgi:transposase-like protein
MKKRIIRFSEAFKLEVVSAIESGEVEGIRQTMKRFGITGSTTVKSWLYKYGKNHLIPFEVACEEFGVEDIESFKKKLDNRL